MPKLVGDGTPMFLDGTDTCSSYYCVIRFGANAVVDFWKTIPQGRRRGGHVDMRHGTKPREVNSLIVYVTTTMRRCLLSLWAQDRTVFLPPKGTKN